MERKDHAEVERDDSEVTKGVAKLLGVAAIGAIEEKELISQIDDINLEITGLEEGAKSIKGVIGQKKDIRHSQQDAKYKIDTDRRKQYQETRMQIMADIREKQEQGDKLTRQDAIDWLVAKRADENEKLEEETTHVTESLEQVYALADHEGWVLVVDQPIHSPGISFHAKTEGEVEFELARYLISRGGHPNVDDKLCVTFFDTEGKKVKVLLEDSQVRTDNLRYHPRTHFLEGAEESRSDALKLIEENISHNSLTYGDVFLNFKRVEELLGYYKIFSKDPAGYKRVEDTVAGPLVYNLLAGSRGYGERKSEFGERYLFIMTLQKFPRQYGKFIDLVGALEFQHPGYEKSFLPPANNMVEYAPKDRNGDVRGIDGNYHFEDIASIIIKLEGQDVTKEAIDKKVASFKKRGKKITEALQSAQKDSTAE